MPEETFAEFKARYEKENEAMYHTEMGRNGQYDDLVYVAWEELHPELEGTIYV